MPVYNNTVIIRELTGVINLNYGKRRIENPKIDKWTTST